MSNFQTVPFSPTWDIRTIAGIGEIFHSLLSAQQSTVSSQVSSKESILLTYCADEEIMAITFVPGPKDRGAPMGRLLTYTVSPGHVIKTLVREGGEETSSYCSYVDGIGRLSWREVYTNKPRTKINITDQHIPSHREQLRRELLDNLNRQIQTLTRGKIEAPPTLQYFRNAVESWWIKPGELTDEERRNYFNHTAFMGVVLGVYNRTSPLETAGAGKCWDYWRVDQELQKRVFSALDPFTADGAPTLSELYEAQRLSLRAMKRE